MSRATLLLVILAAACAPSNAATVATAEPAAPRPPDDVHWFRSSAEQEAIYRQTFRLAGEELRRRAANARPGTWATVLDADETVLDNSEFERDLALAAGDYDEESWNDWVRREAATALPGAVEYVRLARSLGGRVIIVTNRDHVVCDATRRNLLAVGVVADLVLCKPASGASDKNPRFESVAAGTASPDLPPLEVLVYVGDNIRDFPRLSQALRTAPDSAFAPFGRTYFIVPNPMYGSWEENPAE